MAELTLYGTVAGGVPSSLVRRLGKATRPDGEQVRDHFGARRQDRNLLTGRSLASAAE
jgi:hypothetical protein